MTRCVGRADRKFPLRCRLSRAWISLNFGKGWLLFHRLIWIVWIEILPPIELDRVINATICKPFLEALVDTELD
jgi:hypothetical protein